MRSNVAIYWKSYIMGEAVQSTMSEHSVGEADALGATEAGHEEPDHQ